MLIEGWNLGEAVQHATGSHRDLRALLRDRRYLVAVARDHEVEPDDLADALRCLSPAPVRRAHHHRRARA